MEPREKSLMEFRDNGANWDTRVKAFIDFLVWCDYVGALPRDFNWLKVDRPIWVCRIHCSIYLSCLKDWQKQALEARISFDKPVHRSDFFGLKKAPHALDVTNFAKLATLKEKAPTEELQDLIHDAYNDAKANEAHRNHHAS